ncbi:hypothetical protein, partial [Acidiplasma cupricumulans]|uniref:hypothetical protein n=1 Tax=Acidiplasma cupricumulans TaxID=312540 RepID=UPI000AD9EC21
IKIPLFNILIYITRQRFFDNSKLYRDNKIKKNDVIPSKTSLYSSVSPGIIYCQNRHFNG